MRRRSALHPSAGGIAPSAHSAADRPFDPEQRKALDSLFSATYEELRRMAAAIRRSDPNATVSPSTLVHSAWLRLAKSKGVAAQSQLHFKRIAAQAMRQILVEAARRRYAQKRGGSVQFVTFEESTGLPISRDQDLLALDTALAQLAEINPRQATLVESRFFGGLDVSETASLLQISPATVLRDWRVARAWLAAEITRRH